MAVQKDKEKWDFVQKVATRSMLADYKLGIADSWVKALTELITNSHQNYHDMFNDPKYPKSEKSATIVIFADADQERFVVRDYGTGIARDGDELKELLLDYSGYIKKSHTPKGRSSFGRGMSDVLFRKKEYANQIWSHKDGKCVAVLARWTDKGPTFSKDLDITDEQIKSEIPEHGTQVIFHWNSKNESRDFPSKKAMLDSLSRYYELKNILNDEQVDVVLLYVDAKETPEPKKLEFVNYEKSANRIGKEIGDIPLEIDSNYNIKIISAKIWRANTVLTQEKGESRTGGLFIEGEHGQVYDLTLFEHEKNYRHASVRIIGQVILSEDAKKYMDDYYKNEGETILTRTREGFRTQTKFYKELKKKLEPWLVDILESESEKSLASPSDHFKEAIEMLNEIAKKLLEAKNLESGEDLGGPGRKKQEKKPLLPDTIEFSPKSPKIEQGVLCKISLKINCERIRSGTKISFRKEGVNRSHYDIKWDTNKVPKPNTDGLAKIPILIKCNELNAFAEICAVTQKMNGEKTEKWCDLVCVPESGPVGPNLTEYLQFVPGKTIVETNVDKQISLWAHQILEPGTKIKIEFTCETHYNETPITFAGDGNQKFTGALHSFEIEVPDVPLEESAYRRIPFTFTGTEEGLKGKITASTDNKQTVPTTCEIEIKNESEHAGGLLSGWKIENSPYTMYAWYEKEDTKVHINVGIPFVREILGKDREEAEARCDKLQEAQVFVAHTMMEVFFDEIVARMYENRIYVFDQVNPTYQEAHDQMVFQKQKLIHDYGKKILNVVAKNIRTKAPGGKLNNLNFIKEGLEFRYWDLDLQQNAIPPISFNEFHQFRGKSATRFTVHFEVNGQEFEVAVYQFDGDEFVVTLHDYAKDGKYKAVMPEIGRFNQIFKTPKKTSSMIILEEPVFSPVEITDWIGKPEQRIRLVPLRYDQYYETPDAPEMNHSNVIIESSPNWASMGEQAIQYAKFSDIYPNFEDDALKNNLVCIVSKRSPLMMAKIFVRTKVVPAFESLNAGAKALNDLIVHCQSNTCDAEASNFSEILTKFGFHFEDKKPKVNLLCKNCS